MSNAPDQTSKQPRSAGELSFESARLLEKLEAMSEEQLDELDFGVVGLDDEQRVVRYNRAETELSGLDKERVLGRKFFSGVAPCLNNELVAGRLQRSDVDELLNYTLALRLAPVKASLRLLCKPGCSRRYLLVRRRSQDSQ